MLIRLCEMHLECLLKLEEPESQLESEGFSHMVFDLPYTISSTGSCMISLTMWNCVIIQSGGNWSRRFEVCTQKYHPKTALHFLPSITQQWKGRWAWFFHCLTSLHPKTGPFANHSVYNTRSWTSFCSDSLHWQQCKISICNSMTWLPTPDLERKFLHCYLFEMVCGA